MFFDINSQALPNFPCHYGLGNLIVNTDTGWHQGRTDQHIVIYKGYMDRARLDQSLAQIVSETEPTHTGNFCVIAWHMAENRFSLHSDRWRSFPIYLDPGHSINNLIPRARTAWTDSLVSWDPSFDIQEVKFDVIGDSVTGTTKTDQICDLLLDKCQRFYNNNPGSIKIFLSGGVDTMLVYSLVLALDLPHEVIWSSHVDHDHFWLANHDDLARHWGYTQIHHWITPSMLASGAPGDEFMMRSPTTANLWFLNRGTSIPQQVKPDDLHWHYFNKPVHQHLFEKQQQDFRPPPDIDRYILNNIVNDWQHWHLGHTLTWTPLRDLDLAKMMLRLPPDQIVAQICRSEISLALIETNRPGLSGLISDQKNCNNSLANLSKWSALMGSN